MMQAVENSKQILFQLYRDEFLKCDPQAKKLDSSYLSTLSNDELVSRVMKYA